jgi:putative NADH-flavin reductase
MGSHPSGARFRFMPVIVVGADTPIGERILERFMGSDRELRAFVTDPGVAPTWRAQGVKVAVGDVSDDTHLSGACLNCFSAVLVMTAAEDDRERAFASSPLAVLASWVRAAEAGGVRRVICVGDIPPPSTTGPEVAVVSPGHPDLVEEVHRLDAVSALD